MIGLHNIVIAGIDLFVAEEGLKRTFDKWVSDVTAWLNGQGTDHAMTFEWFAINLVAANESLELTNDDEKLLAYLDKVSMRYRWLAKLQHSGKLPSETKARITLKQTVKSLGRNDVDMFLMGINGLEVKDFNQAHMNYFLWLRTIADMLNNLLPESGFDAEWLSLPTMTFYIDKTIIGGRVRFNYLIDVVSSRVLWLGKILGTDVKKLITQLNAFKEKPSQIEIVLDPLLKDLKINTEVIATPLMSPLQKELSAKEWLTLAELSISTG